MNNRLIGILLTVTIPFVVVSYFVIQGVAISEKHESYRFQVGVFSSHDSIRGRYLQLSIKPNEVTVKDGFDYKIGQQVYLLLQKDSDGFAFFRKVLKERPLSCSYVKAEVTGRIKNKLFLSFPFDRYYLNKNDAVEIEALYFQTIVISEPKSSYIDVWVSSRGDGLIDSISIGGDVPVSAE